MIRNRMRRAEYWCLTDDVQIATMSFALNKRGCSSVGRALPSQGRGRGFESLHLHHVYFEPLHGALFMCGQGAWIRTREGATGLSCAGGSPLVRGLVQESAEKWSGTTDQCPTRPRIDTRMGQKPVRIRGPVPHSSAVLHRFLSETADQLHLVRGWGRTGGPFRP